MEYNYAINGKTKIRGKEEYYLEIVILRKFDFNFTLTLTYKENFIKFIENISKIFCLKNLFLQKCLIYFAFVKIVVIKETF